jgi:hypothetical protein
MRIDLDEAAAGGPGSAWFPIGSLSPSRCFARTVFAW